MIKFDRDCGYFKYYNKNGEHEFINRPSYNQSAEIINDLMSCPEFRYDSTILNALYMAMRKLQGFSNNDIQRMMS